MKITNEIVTVKFAPTWKEKTNNSKFVELLVISKKFFSTKKGKQTKTTEYTLRCFGNQQWLESIHKNATTGSELIISGSLDQRSVNIDGKSVLVTVIVINRPDDISYAVIREAS